MQNLRQGRIAFTLLELLVVSAIVTVLTALTIVAVQRAREAANRTHCQNNLRQIGLALHQYHEAHRVFPPACSTRKGDKLFLAWTARMLPWLEQGGLWKKVEEAFSADRRFWSPAHVEARKTVVPTFICPSDGRVMANPRPENTFAAVTHYLGIAGGKDRTGMLFLNSRVRLADVTDGASSTVVVGERPPSLDQRFGWWYAGVGQKNDGNLDSHMAAIEFNRTFRAPTCPFGPYTYQVGSPNNLCEMFHFWSLHPGGANFLFADGSVRFLSYSAAAVLPALATRAGGETVTVP